MFFLGLNLPRIVPVAGAIMTGTAIGRIDLPWWTWLIPAAGTLVVLRGQYLSLLVTLVMLAASWSGSHRQSLSRYDLLALSGHGSEPVLVCLEGEIGSVSGRRIQMYVSGWFDGERLIPAHGRVVLRTPTLIDRPLAGRTVRCVGWLRTIQPPQDPDDIDWLSLAIDGNYRGWMPIESMDLIRVVPRGESSLGSLRSKFRNLIQERILSPPVPPEGAVRSLLLALLIGQHDHQWKRVAPPFRRIGVAHLLAISGMHVGLVAAIIALVLTVIPADPRLRWGLVLGGLLVYLLAVEWRPPIIRAGLMTMCGGVALLGGSRIRGVGLLAMAASIIVVVQPGQIARPGFQLSFLVVLGLMIGANAVRDRWFGSRHQNASRMASVLGQWTLTALAVSVTAWLISVPLVIHHFGQFSPLGPALGLVFLGPVSVMLAVGMLRVMVGWIPEIDALLGHVLQGLAESILIAVDHIDTWRWSSIEGIQVHWTWACLAVPWTFAWCCWSGHRSLIWLVGILLTAWILLSYST